MKCEFVCMGRLVRVAPILLVAAVYLNARTAWAGVLPALGSAQLLVDPVTGRTQISFNREPIASYTIKSTVGKSIRPQFWTSLASQGYPDWQELSASTKSLSEFAPTSELGVGVYNLGALYNPGGAQDWGFKYTAEIDPNSQQLTLFSGQVIYTTLDSQIAAGAHGSASLIGGTTDVGGVVANLNAVSTAGTLSATLVAPTPAELAASTGQVNFSLPANTTQFQQWNLGFTGTFTGGAQVTFNYDPSLLAPGQDPSQLQIYHFDHSGNWVPLTGVLDSVNHTITVNTDSFSPFALGAVPEPTSCALLTLIGGGMLARRRRPFGRAKTYSLR